ncbi:alpha/beta hydrolase [Pseudanabaena sp. FACHB-2040]|uniref:alpha/beta hydrolase n=1 Tax=Pseudanabaena sp. FACHB-2040 TaxID=2692859 RepID=UPI001683B175|nr:alpha/beta hydrolase [Pseudanabaena sp. FACHB-2040]MBD2259328.1 alpha/beta hydrolase [Pseudanabaena sp. FACHB-2040]
MKYLLSAAIASTAILIAATAEAAQVRQVTFESQGETLVGNLYLPDNYTAGQELPGIVVTGSWTSVKEQMSGLYAEELADRGFAALAFDFRNFGESEGAIRALESPAMKIEDIQAAATFMPTLPEVADEQIGGLAICASAGYMAHAIAQGAPLQSFATVAAWLHDAETARALYTPDRYDRLIAASQQAAALYTAEGTVEYTIAATNDETIDLAAMRWADPSFYYTSPDRGAISQYDNRFPVMAWEGWLTFDALAAADGIDVPYFMVHGDQMAIPDNAKAFYASVDAPKSMQWIEGFQMDYYDQPDLVSNAVDLVTDHFRQTLQ